jgi:hypothetical protein
VAVAPPGAKPSAVRTDVVEVLATLEDIDYANRKLTLRGPGGETRRIDIGENVQIPDKLKKGDTVLVRHTEAVAVSVTK